MKFQAIFNHKTTFLATIFVIGLACVIAQQSGWSQFGKPGQCPPSDPNMACVEQPEQCQADCECSKKEKCCFQETCGNICKEPTVVVDYGQTCSQQIKPSQKPGTCPEPYLTVRCAQCYDQCRSDCECPGQQKCCEQPGCGNWCRYTVESGNNTR